MWARCFRTYATTRRGLLKPFRAPLRAIQPVQRPLRQMSFFRNLGMSTKTQATKVIDSKTTAETTKPQTGVLDSIKLFQKPESTVAIDYKYRYNLLTDVLSVPACVGVSKYLCQTHHFYSVGNFIFFVGLTMSFMIICDTLYWFGLLEGLTMFLILVFLCSLVPDFEK